MGAGRLHPALPSAPRVILFDWDGTLFDSFEATRGASLAVFRHFGIALDDARYHETYRPDWHETYRLLGIPEDRWDEAGGIWHAEYNARAARTGLLPGAIETLDALGATGARTGIVTSASRERLDADLDRAGLGERFDVTVAFEEAKRKKPHPEGLFLAIGRLGADPGTVLYVGDRPEDLVMGQRAGVRTAGVASPFSSEALLAEAGPDLMLGRIGDLASRLENPG